LICNFVNFITGLEPQVIHACTPTVLCQLCYRTGTINPSSCTVWLLCQLCYIIGPQVLYHVLLCANFVKDRNHKSFILYAYFVKLVTGLEPQVLYHVLLLCKHCYRTGTTSPSTCMPTLSTLEHDWKHKYFILYSFFIIFLQDRNHKPFILYATLSTLFRTGPQVFYHVLLLCKLCYRTGTISPSSCTPTLLNLLQDWNHKSFILYAYFANFVTGLEP
jgi:hypothetical protein